MCWLSVPVHFQSQIPGIIDVAGLIDYVEGGGVARIDAEGLDVAEPGIGDLGQIQNPGVVKGRYFEFRHRVHRLRG